MTTKLKGTILFQRSSANSLLIYLKMAIYVSLILREKKKVKEQERWEVYGFVEREVGREKNEERSQGKEER